MLPPSLSLSSNEKERSPELTSPTPNHSPSEKAAELSDVPCFTCRRRHVKCDRVLPTCLKCVKKQVPCLGYQKPLRWAEGVAVRGKMKGKLLPVVDDKVATIVQNTKQAAPQSVLQEATHIGIYSSEDTFTNESRNQATLLDLINYHNSVICEEKISFENSKFITRSIARLSYEAVEKLPKDIVNCILGIAAVHMASRQPGNLHLEQLALNAKANVFGSFNLRLLNPQGQRPDVVVCCGGLIYAMDLLEQGTARWLVHYLGSLNVMSSFGGMENLCHFFPHLQLHVAHHAYFETFWPILHPLAVTTLKQCSRTGLESVLTAPEVKHQFFNPCPMPLALAMWDTGACAFRLLSDRHVITQADLKHREHILSRILSFRPDNGSQDARGFYFADTPLDDIRRRNWDAINVAWKEALTIIVLRFLYFGRSDLVFPSKASPLRTPLLETSQEVSRPPIVNKEPYCQVIAGFSKITTEVPESSSGGLNFQGSISRSHSRSAFTETRGQGLWASRYDIHDEAFVSLSTSLLAIRATADLDCMRYILMPLIVLALVSRPGSIERNLCLEYFDRFKESMKIRRPSGQRGSIPQRQSSPSSQGGLELNFKIPWERLDAFSSEVVEQQRHDILGKAVDGPLKGAPEWNWWDMLNSTRLDLTWPIVSGVAHVERGHEFQAFSLISSIVNDECFAAWGIQGQSHTSSSSSIA